MRPRPGQQHKYEVPGPETNIPGTSGRKTRRQGTSGRDSDVLGAQNTVLAQRNQEMLRQLHS